MIWQTLPYIGLSLIFELASSTYSQTVADHSVGPVLLTESTNQSDYAMSWVRSGNQLDILHKTLFDIIVEVYPESIPVFDESKLPETKYDLKISGTNADYEDYWRVLEPELRKRFLIIFSRERRVIRLYEIKVKKSPPPGLTNSSPNQPRSETLEKGRWQYTAYTASDLEDILQKHLSTPVYDETGLTNAYNFSLDSFYWTSTNNAIKAVKELGLSLESATKEKDVLVISNLHLNLFSFPK